MITITNGKIFIPIRLENEGRLIKTSNILSDILVKKIECKMMLHKCL